MIAVTTPPRTAIFTAPVSASAHHRTGRLLVGFDDSDGAPAALAWAIQHSGAAGDVLVASVAEPGSASAGRLTDALASLSSDPALAECAWAPVLLEGWMTPETLVRAARECGADAIVVGSHGYCPVSAVAGSVSHRLLEVSDVPVVIVPNPHDKVRR